MDTITHIVLGACVGEAILGNKIAKRAMFLGAVAQSIPDIDFIASFWLDTSENLLAHRGFTHSVLFILLLTPVLGKIAERIHRPHNITLTRWMIFFGVEMFIHILLDGFNNYGVGWFEPFSHARISFHTIYVADPLFTLFPAIAFVALLLHKGESEKRRYWWRMALLMCSFYLCFSLINKFNINAQVQKAFRYQDIPHKRYFTTPAPLQNLLWMVVAGNEKGYYVGFRSVLDSKPEIAFQYFPTNNSLLDPVRDHEDVAHLVRFSKGFFTVEKWTDTLIFNDLRFGQIIGWDDPREKFVFHFFLEHNANEMVVQRGRFAKWDRHSIRSFFRRIWGN